MMKEITIINNTGRDISITWEVNDGDLVNIHDDKAALIPTDVHFTLGTDFGGTAAVLHDGDRYRYRTYGNCGEVLK